ncbi:MAG: MBL fold metallo-hydrolase [Clostridiales bacterium]|jgi:ribonuclease BN (tRNA processing enzyme)|nr:MBL fold metallo-hydrolase [Clostridiales bacterium]
MKLKFYGARGSTPVYLPENAGYGCNSMCAALSFEDYCLVFDCGTGASPLRREEAGRAARLDLLISHLHIDHIVGLPALADAPGAVSLYTVSRDERPLPEQVFGVFKPPYWPVSFAEAFGARVCEVFPNTPFFLKNGEIKATPFRLPHPDFTTGFRIECGGKVLVYMSDCEMAGERTPEEAFGADLIIFDAAYSPEDYEKFRGYGHSTYEDAARVKRESGCKRMLLAHFDQAYSDREMDGFAERLRAIDENIELAREMGTWEI